VHEEQTREEMLHNVSARDFLKLLRSAHITALTNVHVAARRWDWLRETNILLHLNTSWYCYNQLLHFLHRLLSLKVIAISMPYAYRTPIRVWDSKTIPYAYGISHTRIGRPMHTLTGQNTSIVQNNSNLIVTREKYFCFM